MKLETLPFIWLPKKTSYQFLISDHLLVGVFMVERVILKTKSDAHLFTLQQKRVTGLFVKWF